MGKVKCYFLLEIQIILRISGQLPGGLKLLQIRPRMGSDLTADDPFRPQKKSDIGHFGTQTRPHWYVT